MRNRIVEYKNKTSIVADYYKPFNKVKSIKGEGTLDEIFELLSKEIDSKIA